MVVLADSETWVQPLITALEAQGLQPRLFNLPTMTWNTHVGFGEWGLVVNRIASRPEMGTGHPTALLRKAQDLLAAVELAGIPCIHGSQTYAVGSSKALQAACFSQLGLSTPATRYLLDGEWPATQTDPDTPAVDCREWLLKPNAGGFGRGIVSADQADTSAAFALDGTAVLQQRVHPGEPVVYRAEFVGRELAYVAASPIDTTETDYCLAHSDAAVTLSRDLSPAIYNACMELFRLIGMQLGSVEYMIDRDGAPVFIDINPVSSPHPGIGAELGIDLWQMHAELISGVWSRRNLQSK